MEERKDFFAVVKLRFTAVRPRRAVARLAISAAQHAGRRIPTWSSSLTRVLSARARAVDAISALPHVSFMPAVSLAKSSPQLDRRRLVIVAPSDMCSGLRALK